MVSTQHVIPTGFVVQVLRLDLAPKPAHRLAVGNQVFAVTSAAATDSRQWLKSSG
jgi:hypothetical protein